MNERIIMDPIPLPLPLPKPLRPFLFLVSVPASLFFVPNPSSSPPTSPPPSPPPSPTPSSSTSPSPPPSVLPLCQSVVSIEKEPERL